MPSLDGAYYGSGVYGQVLYGTQAGNVFGYGCLATWNQARYGNSGALLHSQQYDALAEFLGYHAPSYAASGDEVGYFAPSYGTDDEFGYFAPSYQANVEELGYFAPCYDADPAEEVTTVAFGVPGSNYDSATYDSGTYQHEYYPAGSSLSPYFLAWKYGRTKTGAKAAATAIGTVVGIDVQKADPLVLTLRESGPTEVVFEVPDGETSHPDVTGQQILNSSIAFSVVFGGRRLNYEGKSYSFGDQEEALRKFVGVSFGGTDLVHVALTVEDQEMPSVRSTKHARTSMKTVVREICDEYGVPVEIHCEDYDVPIFNRQGGRPLEWIADLIEPVMAEYRVEDGRRLVIYVPGETGVKPWFYSSSDGVMPRKSSSTTLGSVYNAVRIVRTVNAGTRAKEDEVPFEVYAFGTDIPFDFDEPLRNVSYRVHAANSGAFEDLRLLDRNGLIVGVLRPPADKNYPVSVLGGVTSKDVWGVRVRWRAASIEVQNAGITGGYGAISFFGSKLASSEVDEDGEMIETAFEVEEEDAESIGKYGRRFREISPSPLIPDEATARLYAVRWLRFVGRPRRDFQFVVPVNPDMLPGHRIQWRNDRLGTTKDMTITQVQHGPLTDFERPYTTFVAYELL